MALCPCKVTAFLLAATLICCVSADEEVNNTESKLVVHLPSESGNCTVPGSNMSCHSLEQVASSFADYVGSVEIIIHSVGLVLSEPVTFHNFSEITIVSTTSVNITCTSFAGLVFISVSRLCLENITLVQCGALQNFSVETGEREAATFRSAVHIISCGNVTIRKTSVISSEGAGIALVDNRGDVVNISHCHFINNSVPQEDRYSYNGGGGIYVRTQRPDKPHEYYFNSCCFVHNRHSTTRDYVFVTSFGSILRGTGRGGGLDILLRGSSASNRIKISGCNFTENAAFLGGGLAIQIEDRAHNNSAFVEDSRFERNGCHYTTGYSQAGSGGGAHLGYSLYSKATEQANDNHFSVMNVTFRENCAELGGGATFFSSRSSYADFNNSISFSNSTWLNNSARVGAAVDISPHVFERLSGGFLPTPLFTSCSFIDNTVIFTTQDMHQAYGTGTLFSSLFNVIFNSSVHFEGNSGSAFIIVNGIADFSTCNATFINNTGLQGGAIALIGISSMLIGPGCYYSFINNQATDRGGAIYSQLIDDHDFVVSRSCFIRYLDKPGVITPPPEWNATLTFIGNSANRYGRAIFATSLIPCQRRVSSSSNNGSATWSASEILQWPGVFIYDNDNFSNQIATEGAHFDITGSLPFIIVPGEEHSLEVAIIDDLDQAVDFTFRGTIVDENSTISVDEAFTCVVGNVIQLQGREGNSGDLLLQTVTARKSSIIVQVKLAPCPPGFTLGDNMECYCDAFSYVGITRCSHSDFHAYIIKGFWAGYIDKPSQFVTAICPLGFCTYNGFNLSDDIPLPNNYSMLDSFMCGPKRTGILCGKCSLGYSTYYHSPYYSCEEERLCSLGWLFYILSEIVPVTLIFMLILTLNISFSSGAVNGFILFSQLLDTLLVNTSGTIKFHEAVDYLTAGYRLIYGFFNLDLFNIDYFSFCLWPNATVLDILAFKYVTIVYALVLIFSVILFMKHCGHRCLGKYIRITTLKSSIIHGLSAFLVVCYAQCVKVSLTLLLPETLKGRKGAVYLPRRVWFNGEIEEFGKEHLRYAIPALLCLLTIGVVPPLLLLAYPLTNKLLAFAGLGESKLSTILTPKISKLKPLLDSFQGCFKNGLRFFAGLYFLYRWIGLVVYSIAPSLSAFYAGTEGVLIFILTVHAVAQPYEKRWHNIVDALLLADLVAINGLTLYNYYHYSQATANTITGDLRNAAMGLQLVLIYLPILYMATYVLIVICKKYRIWKKQRLQAQARGNTEPSFTPLDEFPHRLLEENNHEYHWIAH